MRYFVDTEFITVEGRWTPERVLLSLGVVAEDGREFYAINTVCPTSLADPWVREHVLIHIVAEPEAWRMPDQIRDGLKAFIGDDVPEFWADYGAFDYVLVSELLGSFADWPPSWPMYFNDLQQACRMAGVPAPASTSDHHALHDARQLARDHREARR